MRQIVSLIKDNQAHYALVDDEDGSLIPFADVLIPDPDRFGLHESAVLGTNLISALGLNGTKRPKTTMVTLANVPPTQRQPEPGPEALPPAPPRNETARDRRNRIARESYHRNKQGQGQGPGRGRPANRANHNAQRYIAMDEVQAVIDQYPEGIRLRDVVERIWRTNEGQGTDETYPSWYYTAVSNRLTGARVKLKEKGTPLPFREEDRPEPDMHGQFHGQTAKYLFPVSSSPPEPEAAQPDDASQQIVG